MDNIHHSVISIIKEILEFNKEIDLDESLGKIGLDSLNSVSLIVMLEDRFDIMFNDSELVFENFLTVNKIIETVQNKVTGR